MDAIIAIIPIAAVIFVAALVRSALGFGDAVLAMPLLTLLVGVKTATPLVAFMGPTISILVLARHWRKGDRAIAIRLVAASFLGIPVGVYGLARLPETPLRTILGAVILAYGVFGLLRPARHSLRDGGEPGRNGRGAWPVGFGAGILGGAYNTNGPPVVIYGIMRGWPPETFRATLQSYFLPTGLLILAGHGIAGFWTAQVIRLYALSLPALLLGVAAGGAIHGRLAPERFRTLVYLFLAAMGAVLVIRTLAGS